MTGSASALLALTDTGRAVGPLGRGLAIAAFGGSDAGALRAAPVGRLNAAVLAVRAAIAGDRLASVAAFPQCGARVEFEVGAEELLAFADTPIDASGRVEASGYRVAWRPPTTGDLIDAATDADPAERLRTTCITAERDGEPIAPRDLPASVLDAVEHAMAAADPLSEIVVAVRCPECAGSFDADLDPVAFVWAELEARARRVLGDVDVIARAYGWSETEVLALSDARRAAYLDIILGRR